MSQPEPTADTPIQPGLTGKASLRVDRQHSARHLGSGAVEVLATPQMVLLMEQASVAAVDHLLPPGHCTVGARIDVKHLTPTPTGYYVEATAELVDVRDRRLTFRVQVHEYPPQEDASGPDLTHPLTSPTTLVGEGTHHRVTVNLQQFHQRLQQKTP
jgi:predicted thioesterase